MTLEARELTRVISVKGEVHVLVRDVSFTLQRGTVLGITGPSGSGKSTLLRLLLGLDARSAGAVLLDGAPVIAGALPAMRRQTALVQQVVPVYQGTAWVQLERVLRLSSRASVAPETIRRAFRSHLEALGLASGTAERGWADLSGGERRRAAIALAAALDPRFLLLDEPSDGLDAAASKRLGAWIRERAASGTGLLVVTHDELLLARTADTLLVMYEGEVQGSGTPRDLIPAAVETSRREVPGTGS